MKLLLTAVVLALATLGSTQTVLPPGNPPQCDALTKRIPECALECLNKGAAGVGCAQTDYLCKCDPNTKKAISSIATPCVIQKCPLRLLNEVIKVTDDICVCAAEYKDVPSQTETTGGNEPTKTPCPEPEPVCKTEIAAVLSCAIAPIDAAGKSFGCAAGDYACLCANYNALISAATPAVAEACGGVLNALPVLDQTKAVCTCLANAPAVSSCDGGNGSVTPKPTESSTVEPEPSQTETTGGNEPTITPCPEPEPVCETEIAAVLSCAIAPIDAAGKSFGCAAGDYACLCANYDALISAATPAVAEACGGVLNALPVLDQTKAVCTCLANAPAPSSCDGGNGSVTPKPTESSTVKPEPSQTETTGGNEPTITPCPEPEPVCETEIAAVLSCAIAPIDAAGKSFGCAAGDYACLCANYDALISAATPAVAEACGGVLNALPVLDQTKAVCTCLANAPAQSSCDGGNGSVTPKPTESSTVKPEPSQTETTGGNEPTITPCPEPEPVCETEIAAVLSCAIAPIDAAGKSFGCAAGDYACLCANYNALISAATPAVAEACGGVLNALPVLDQTKAVCTCLANAPAPSSCDGGNGSVTPKPTESSTVKPEPSQTETTGGNEPTITPCPEPEPVCETEIAAVLSCAIAPIDAAGKSFGCAAGDYACLCANYDALISAATPAVAEACGGVLNALPVLDQTKAVCECIANTPVKAPSCTTLTAPPPPPGSTIITTSKTITSTITSCPPTVTKCPYGSTTTTVTTYTTICPIETGDVPAHPTKGPDNPTTPGDDNNDDEECAEAKPVCETEVAAVLSCAIKPLDEAGKAFGCSPGEYTCLCSNYDALVSAVTPAVAKACGGVLNALPVLDQTKAVCDCIKAAPARGDDCGENLGGPGEGENPEAPAPGGETEQPEAPTPGGETPSEGGETEGESPEAPVPGGETPSESGEPETPSEGGETEGESPEAPVPGGETPSEGGETETPSEGGETEGESPETPVPGGETPSEGGETETPSEGGETEGESPEAPAPGVETPTEGGETETPTEGEESEAPQFTGAASNVKMVATSWIAVAAAVVYVL